MAEDTNPIGQDTNPIGQDTNPIGQDTGKFRTNDKDQFYTKPDVAKECIQKIITYLPDFDEYIWIEPSAGNGSFLHNTPESIEKIGFDIAPGSEDIKQQDYLTWELPIREKKFLIFGNPPFGRQSSTAKAFIAKACREAAVIAFILPRSFVKPSMYSAFDTKFHLRKSWDLPENSFLVNNEPYDVPCVFQIWQRKNVDRPEIQAQNPRGFRYVKQTDQHDLIIRRVGVNAGRCYATDPDRQFSLQSHYFIKLETPINSDALREKINAHEFPSNTVGPRSISKGELNTVLNECISSLVE